MNGARHGALFLFHARGVGGWIISQTIGASRFAARFCASRAIKSCAHCRLKSRFPFRTPNIRLHDLRLRQCHVVLEVSGLSLLCIHHVGVHQFRHEWLGECFAGRC